MASITPVSALNDAFLSAATAALAALDGAKMELYQNDYTPTPATVLGDLTVATYTGYAGKTVTWSGITVGSDSQHEVIGTVAAAFRPTGTTITNQIFGWYLTNTAGSTLFAAGRFDGAPLPMLSALNAILPIVQLRATPSGPITVAP